MCQHVTGPSCIISFKNRESGAYPRPLAPLRWPEIIYYPRIKNAPEESLLHFRLKDDGKREERGTAFGKT